MIMRFLGWAAETTWEWQCGFKGNLFTLPVHHAGTMMSPGYQLMRNVEETAALALCPWQPNDCVKVFSGCFNSEIFDQSSWPGMCLPMGQLGQDGEQRLLKCICGLSLLLATLCLASVIVPRWWWWCWAAVRKQVISAWKWLVCSDLHPNDGATTSWQRTSLASSTCVQVERVSEVRPNTKSRQHTDAGTAAHPAKWLHSPNMPDRGGRWAGLTAYPCWHGSVPKTSGPVMRYD